ncbi:unnamed protein product [Durusdinium trenchii]|uniref:F-box domain-containing protein n=1 Tax=Durusdinium trenchii TaxID=1381693 RepID=A0ABP0RIJ0_9DINO
MDHGRGSPPPWQYSRPEPPSSQAYGGPMQASGGPMQTATVMDRAIVRAGPTWQDSDSTDPKAQWTHGPNRLSLPSRSAPSSAQQAGFTKKDFDEVSKWLAQLLRDPRKARKYNLELDHDGWAKFQDVERCLRGHRSELRRRLVPLLRRVIQQSKYDDGPQAGQERFELGWWQREEYVRSKRKRRNERPPENVQQLERAGGAVFPPARQPVENLALLPKRAPTADMPRAAERPEKVAWPEREPPAICDISQATDEHLTQRPERAPPAIANIPQQKVERRARSFYLPSHVFKLIWDFVESYRELRCLMSCSKEWEKGIWPLLKCPAGPTDRQKCGLKEISLRCGHKICGGCKDKQSKCPVCWRFPRDEGDYNSLKSMDNPRTSEPSQRDTASLYSISEEEEHHPLDVTESYWAQHYFPDARATTVVRHWVLIREGKQKVAKVFFSTGAIQFLTLDLRQYEEHSYFHLTSKSCDTEFAAVQNVLAQTAARPKNRWNRINHNFN